MSLPRYEVLGLGIDERIKALIEQTAAAGETLIHEELHEVVQVLTTRYEALAERVEALERSRPNPRTKRSGEG